MRFPGLQYDNTTLEFASPPLLDAACFLCLSPESGTSLCRDALSLPKLTAGIRFLSQLLIGVGKEGVRVN